MKLVVEKKPCVLQLLQRSSVMSSRCADSQNTKKHLHVKSMQYLNESKSPALFFLQQQLRTFHGVLSLVENCRRDEDRCHFMRISPSSAEV